MNTNQMLLTVNGTFKLNPEPILEQEESIPLTFPGLVSWAAWTELDPSIRGGKIWLDPAVPFERLQPSLAVLQVIGIHFSVFSDGRGLSYARVLRQEYKYDGDLRAIGDIGRDQLDGLRRCGFSSFLLRVGEDEAEASHGLRPFANSYQDIRFGKPLPLS